MYILVAAGVSLIIASYFILGVLYPKVWKNYTVRRRALDLQYVWPACVKQAKDLDHAKAAFAFHVSMDPAWTNHYTEEELRSFIDELKAPLDI